MEKRIIGGIYKFQGNRKYVGKRASCEEKITSRWHAFAVLRIEDDYCTGFMLTHASTKQFPEHQSMQEKHFVPGLAFSFDDTYFLRVPLIKMHNLATTQVGLLTKEGQEFITSFALGREMTWEDYIREYCQDE